MFTFHEVNSFLEVTVLEDESTAPKILLPLAVYLGAQTGVSQGHVKVSATNITSLCLSLLR